ncbi:MAG: FAD/NAD(P)-binding protein [Proteobacteria bacterium]|nr:FAD/NAD(P)-binding protein [Pseudomonadota bacterium]
MTTVAIVGAGFSGAALATHLLRRHQGAPLEVELIERGAEVGRGVAYARRDHEYLLNVPAARMSATPSDPEEFLRYARVRRAGISGEAFLPRALFGDYLSSILREAEESADPSVRLRRIRAEVVDLELNGEGEPRAVVLADGTRIESDRVVLATGASAPRLPAGIRAELAAGHQRRDPWAEPRPNPLGRPLVVLGMGLTMVDVVCAAVERDAKVEVHAISRHGLLAPGQSERAALALADSGGLHEAGGSTRRLFAAARVLAHDTERRGGDWRQVITLMRREMPALWRALAPVERARFLRHVRSYWDVHRHRLPGEVLARIEALRAEGRVRLHAGRIESLRSVGDLVRVTWRPRGGGAPQALDAVEVVNATGPDHDVTHFPDRLWRSLLARGRVVPDEFRLGIRTAPLGAVLAADGRAAANLFYLGPLLRADHWDITAVGELREAAVRLADQLSVGRP